MSTLKRKERVVGSGGKRVILKDPRESVGYNCGMLLAYLSPAQMVSSLGGERA